MVIPIQVLYSRFLNETADFLDTGNDQRAACPSFVTVGDTAKEYGKGTEQETSSRQGGHISSILCKQLQHCLSIFLWSCGVFVVQDINNKLPVS